MNKKLLATVLTVTGIAAFSSAAVMADDVKEVHIGFNNSQVPQSYVDENGELAGEFYETLTAIDDLLEDYTFVFDAVTQDTILAGLDAGTYDVGTGFIKNEEREEKYIFPKMPLSAVIRGLILPTEQKENFSEGTAEDALVTFAELGLKMIPVEPGSSADSLFTSFNESHDVKINFEVSEQVDVATSVRYIAEGRYDGTQFMSSNYYAVNEQVDPDGKTFFLNFTDGVFTAWLMYNKDNQELADAVDGAMKTLFENGTMAAISEKYYGANVFSYIEDFEYADVEANADYE